MIEDFLRKITKNRVSQERGEYLRLKYEKFTSQLTNDLHKLAKINKSDKCGAHKYIDAYTAHFEIYKKKPIRLLEIGTGGYDNPKAGGQGSRMFRSYFKKGMIVSIDYFKKNLVADRVIYKQGSQVDNDFLLSLHKDYGPFDIVVDDGSHQNHHMRHTFEFLFPLLTDSGMYVIEDLQTSYWESEGGDSQNLNNPKTIMTFLKSLVDGLNYKEFIKPGYQASYFDTHIKAIHFYHNLCFIEKGDNTEESNMINNNLPTTSIY